MPATVEAGDRLLIFMTSGANGTITTPAGWSLVGSAGGSPKGLYVFSKIAVGNEDGTSVTVATSGSVSTCAWRVLCVQGPHATEAPAFAQVANNFGTMDPPSLTPAWGSDENLWVAAAWKATTAIAGVPAGYTDGGQSANANANQRVRVAYKVATAATEDPGVFEAGGSVDRAVATVAVRAA
jgi:hypothetical protein